jgi:hypothetical protein
MARMCDLAVHIEEYSCQDGRVEELLKWIINQHIQGRVEFSDMPKDAQFCFGMYEQEQKLMKEADEQAQLWEVEHKQRIHDNIQHAVEEGRITYDQGMELIDNPEQAEQWDREGIL